MCKKVSSPSETATATEGKKNSSTLMIRDAVRGFAIGIHREEEEEEDGPAKRESNATGIAIRRRIVCAGRGRAGDSAALRRVFLIQSDRFSSVCFCLLLLGRSQE